MGLFKKWQKSEAFKREMAKVNTVDEKSENGNTFVQLDKPKLQRAIMDLKATTK